MNINLSKLEQLQKLSPAQKKSFIESLTEEELLNLHYDWSFHARPKQIEPDGDWFVWLLQCGRGFG